MYHRQSQKNKYLSYILSIVNLHLTKQFLPMISSTNSKNESSTTKRSSERSKNKNSNKEIRMKLSSMLKRTIKRNSTLSQIPKMKNAMRQKHQTNIKKVTVSQIYLKSKTTKRRKKKKRQISRDLSLCLEDTVI